MKKNIIAIICSIFILGGCDDFLDRQPLSDMSPGTFFQSKGDMRTWNAGIYDALQSTLHQKHLDWGDLRSDNYHTTGYESAKVYMNAMESTMGETSWQDLYTTINLCNIAIKRYPTIPQILESETNPYIGQAYGIRALMYFYGIRVWGRVPLITEPWEGDLTQIAVPRSSIEEVKAQIMEDINFALAALGNDVSDKFYFNRAAAYALKTDVHMWFKEYEAALAASAYFIGNSNFALVKNETEWKEIFTKPASSKESIFNLAWSYEADGAHGWAQRVGANNTNNGYKMSQSIFEEFVDRLRSGNGTDARFWNNVDTVKLFYNGQRLPLTYANWTTSGIEKCTKYSNIDPDREFDSKNGVYKSFWAILSSSNAELQIPIYRLADVLLLRAEALNKTGKPTDALNIVNQMRNRVGYTADAKLEVNIADQTAVEMLILQERQLEFIAEGKRWFDLMRTDHLLEVMDPVIKARQEAAGVQVTGFTQAEEGKKYMPIYYREFESNTALKGDQNPPYSEG